MTASFRTVALVLLGLAAHLSAAVECRVQAVVPWFGDGGWTPVILTVTSPVDHQTDMTLEYMDSRVRTRFALAAGVPVQRTVLVPPGPGYPGGLTIQWQHPDRERGHHYASPVVGEGCHLVVVSTSRQLDDFQRQRLASHFPATSTRHHHGSPSNQIVLAPTALPEYWQGYRRDLVLWFDRGEESRLTAGQRQAIQRWAALGGILVFCDPTEAKAWTLGACQPIVSDFAALKPGGGKTKDEHRKEIDRDPAMKGKSSSDREALAEQRAQADLDQEQRLAGPLLTVVKDAIRQRDTNSTGLETAIPDKVIPGTAATGGWAYAIIAIVFAIGAGPGLLWWARRRGQPLLLVVAIPACGLATCLLLLGWDLMRYGISRQRSAVELTLIDPARAEHLAFSGQTLFGAFALSRLSLADGEQWLARGGVASTGYRRRYYSGSGNDQDQRPLSADWERQELQGDLVRGRITGHLGCTVIRPDRRRIVVQRRGDGYQVTNGLGVALTAFAWRDGDGKAWISGPIADGATDLLKKDADRVVMPPIDRLPRQAGARWMAALKQPGAWRATLAAPLAPLPGPAAKDAEPVLAFACGTAVAVEATP